MARKKELETSMEELDAVLAELEKEDVTLEKSFALYQKGMKLLKECNDSIDKVEKEMIILNEQESGEQNGI